MRSAARAAPLLQAPRLGHLMGLRAEDLGGAGVGDQRGASLFGRHGAVDLAHLPGVVDNEDVDAQEEEVERASRLF
jgi:hypothetical protein